MADVAQSSVPTIMRQGRLKVTIAPTGARKMKADHQALPITTEEIARTAADCYAAGAHEIHLHVRDDQGQHSLDSARYRETMAAIQMLVPDMAIQITTEAAGVFDVGAQFAVLKALVPPSASVSVREVGRDERVAAKIYAFAREAQIDVQHILYDAKDISQYKHLLETGVISEDQRSVLLVLGAYGSIKPIDSVELGRRLALLDGAMSHWCVCAFGTQENALLEQAIKLGGDVRVGFENNHLRPDGSHAANNAENVARVVASVRRLGRPMILGAQA